MKTFRLLLGLFSIVLVTVSSAQESVPDASNPTAPLAQRSPEYLDDLLGPIALYPDALIALILPAATVPTDIVLAARHLRDTGNGLSQVESRAWDDSVKSLTRYPDVVKWMDENLDWTKQVGEAFAEQPAEVMKAVQRLRAKARAAGTLTDTPQQHVVTEPDVIRIIPAQPDVIYVPRYEPDIVFVDRPIYYPRPVVTFGVGFAVGSWLAYDCDWRRRTIWIGDRRRHWSHHDWRKPLVPIHPGHGRKPPRQWCPPAQLPRATLATAHRFTGHAARPGPVPGASGYSARRSFDRDRDHSRGYPHRTSVPATHSRSFTTRSSVEYPAPRPAHVGRAPNSSYFTPQPRVTIAPPLPTQRATTVTAPRREVHGRTFRGAPVGPQPLPTAPALPMARYESRQRATVVGNAAPASAHRAAPPIPAPALPQAGSSSPHASPPSYAPAPAPASSQGRSSDGSRDYTRRSNRMMR